MADLFNQAKNLLSGRKPDEDKAIPEDNRIDRNDQCKVVWYQWANELGTGSNAAFNLNALMPAVAGEDAKLAESRSYDISNHITSFTFSKSMGAASGSFSFALENSFDWPRFMRPGQWVCVYLTGDGDLPLPVEMHSNVNSLGLGGLGSEDSVQKAKNLITSAVGLNSLNSVPHLPLPPGPDAKAIASYKSKLKCLGIIQRVAVKSITTSDGTVETTFTVTGKDFGGIYEDTELWFNANNADGKSFEAVLKAINTQFSRNLQPLLGKWHDIFLNTNKVVPKSIANLTAYFPDQWILPNQMVKDLGLKIDGIHFGDIVDLQEFNPTGFENPDPNLLSGLEGRAWDRLKNCSQPEFHELFTELSDSGNPRLYFRPIPWALDKSRYPSLGKLMLSYEDLASGNPVPAPRGIPDIGSTLASLASGFGAEVLGAGDDARVNHSIDLTATEVQGYDIGPDFHSRANFFLVEATRSALDQKNSFATISKMTNSSFPFRDEKDIKRHGFRPLFISLQTFNISNASLFADSPYGNSPPAAFMIECNEILRDFHANSEDMYSGTLDLAIGKSGIKLGKVILTDDSFQGISDMIFYIEGYTDTFSVDPQDGVATWTQTISVTRGIQKNVLAGGSTKDKQATQVGTFHVFNKDAKREDSGPLGKLKNAIKKPF